MFIGHSPPPPEYDFFVFLTVPTVKPRQNMKAYHFYHNPFRLPSGDIAVWNQEEGLFGVSHTLYPQEEEFTFIPDRFIPRSCRKYPLAWLWDAPTAHQRSCISDLFYNSSTTCTTSRPANDQAHLVHSEHLLFYFPERTQILVTCPNSQPTQTWDQGLIQVEDRPGCELTSSALSYKFNGAKPGITIHKSTHAVIPQSLYNFSMPDFINQPKNNYSVQIQNI